MTTPPSPAGEAVAYPVLDETQRDRLRRYGTVRPVTAGQILYSPANESSDLLVVLSGEVVVSNDALGTSVELARHGPGHFAGEPPSPAARPARAHASRTTSASPTGYPAPS
jgi:CRP-like cAMP-binding protein